MDSQRAGGIPRSVGEADDAHARTVSVISVALNAERTIRRTIESVLGQTSPPAEYIVVDGGSRDRTVEIAREYGNAITTILSGPDDGIYDGMNRGLAVSRGTIVGFLNANDAYAHRDVIGSIQRTFSNPRLDACYGNLDFVSRTGRIMRRWRSSVYEPGLLRSGWVPPHPTFYCRRSVLVGIGGFKKHYRIAGDYELLLRLLAIHKIRVEYIPEVLVNMEAGGVSNGTLRNILSANREVVQAWRENGLPPPRLIGIRKPVAKIAQLRFSR